MTPDEIIVDEAIEAQEVAKPIKTPEESEPNVIDVVAVTDESILDDLEEGDIVVPDYDAIRRDNAEDMLGEDLANEGLMKVIAKYSDEWVCEGLFSSGTNHRIKKRRIMYFKKIETTKVRKEREVVQGDIIDTIAGFSSTVVLIKKDYIVMTKRAKNKGGERDELVKFKTGIFREQFIKGNWFFHGERVPVINIESVVKYLPKGYFIRGVGDSPFVNLNTLKRGACVVSAQGSIYKYIGKAGELLVFVIVDNKDIKISELASLSDRRAILVRADSKIELLEYTKENMGIYPREISREKICDRLGISIDALSIPNGSIPDEEY